MMMRNILLFVAIVVGLSACNPYQVEPGYRGVQVNWGHLKEPALGEGFGVTCPFFCKVYEVRIKQQKQELEADCFSSDLQEIKIKTAVLYSVPESSVLPIFRDFHGEPFDTLVAPRVHEALKEATATRTAEQIAKQRETIKAEALVSARKKIGNAVDVTDIVLIDIGLTTQLKQAIEEKMVQAQEAAKAQFIKDRAQVEAETVIIRADAEAKSIKIRGEALANNPAVVQMQLIEKWQGNVPDVVAGASGLNILLPATTK
jgi:prohibitin 2